MQHTLVGISVLCTERNQHDIAMVSYIVIFRPPVQQENLITFADDTQGDTWSSPSLTDPTFSRGDDKIATYESWFSRPLKVASIPWAENTNIGQNIYPWRAYFTHPEVYAKIKGFSRLQAKLHVKLVVNASPFQYSLGLMSYRPLSGNPDGGVGPSFSGGNMPSFTEFNTNPALMVNTQYPHTFFSPQYSKGAEMDIPFIYWKDWFDLKGPNVAALDSFYSMGRLTIQSFAPLRNSSGTAAANPITVSVFIWASDVKLAGPSMSLQADEYSDKPISTVASAISKAAGALVEIPPLAPFARATMMVAGFVGSVAKFFGFSNPPVIDPVHTMRIGYSANLASPDIPTQIEKLSLDPKNELCIDPRTVGLGGVDEMSIKHILDREVYFASFDWLATDAPDIPLFGFDVNPAVAIVQAQDTPSTLGTAYRVQMTPGALLSQMFAYWRGPITYKFVCLCSQLHRGRIRISYDPSGRWDNTELGTLRLYQKVWDLASSNSFEFTVPYMSTTGFSSTYQAAGNGNPSTNKFWEDRSSSAATTYSSVYFNGCVRLDVMNELTATVATTATVCVFINCKDVEFSKPTDMDHLSGQFSPFELQADIEVSDTVMKDTIPVSPIDDNSYNVYGGEVVRSIRPLIHRANRWATLKPSYLGAAGDVNYSSFNARTSSFRYMFLRWIFPRMPLPFYTAPTGDVTRPPFNYHEVKDVSNGIGSHSPTTMMSLFSMCYIGWRGSVVWRGFYSRPLVGETLRIESATMRRHDRSWTSIRSAVISAFSSPGNNAANVLAGGQVEYTTNYTGDGSVDAKYFTNRVLDSGGVNYYKSTAKSGISRGNPYSNPQLEAVIPMYSKVRMYPGNPEVYFSHCVSDNKLDGTCDNVTIEEVINSDYGTTTMTASGADQHPSIDLYVHGGVDFTLLGFMAVQTMYRYQTTGATVVPRFAPENFD